MIEAFSSGVFVGGFFIFSIFLLFFGIVLFLENSKKNKFLVEIKSLQDYEEWKKRR